MKFDAKITEDDNKFVEATLDKDMRGERIERLSRSRRILYIVSIVQVIVAVLQGLLFLISLLTLPGSKPDRSYFVLPLVLWAFFLASYLYTDLQIKFLKAEAARQANSGG